MKGTVATGIALIAAVKADVNSECAQLCTANGHDADSSELSSCQMFCGAKPPDALASCKEQWCGSSSGGGVIIDVDDGGMDSNMGPADSMGTSMNDLDTLNIDLDGEFDPETGFRHFDQIVADAVAENGDKQSFCKVGLTQKMSGNIAEMIGSSEQEDGEENPFADGKEVNLIPTVVVPCGSGVDVSDFALGVAGAMGFDPDDGLDYKCTGPECHCGGLELKLGLDMKADFNKMLEGEQGAMLKQYGVKSFKDLKGMLDQFGTDMTAQEKEEQKKVFDMLETGFGFSTTMTIFGCVNKEVPVQNAKAYTFDTPSIFPAEAQKEMEKNGLSLKMSTTAAMTVADPSGKPEVKDGATVLYTKSDGSTVEVTVKKVNTVPTSVPGMKTQDGGAADVELPAGASATIVIDGLDVVVATAALTAPEELTALQAPSAPDNKIQDSVDNPGGNNSASSASTGVLASVAALVSVLTLSR